MCLFPYPVAEEYKAVNLMTKIQIIDQEISPNKFDDSVLPTPPTDVHIVSYEINGELYVRRR